MEATTTCAWTVMTSMPMTAIRNQASMTIPLSRTRSRTSTWLPVGLVLSTTTPHSPHAPSCKSHHHHPTPLPHVGDELARGRTFAVGKTLPKVGCLQGHLDTLV